MKKLLISSCVIFLVYFSLIPIDAINKNSTINYYDDGSYSVTIIEESISAYSSGTKTGTKTKKYYNNKNVILWTVSVKGTFDYTSTSATCTNATVLTTCPASTWRIISKSASKNGNSATATATAKQYQNGAVINTINNSITLSCGANGILS